jgi:hypothetical protein
MPPFTGKGKIFGTGSRPEENALQENRWGARSLRANLPAEVLASTEYSFSVYLIPKVANRISSADLAVEFVRYDPNQPGQVKAMEQAIALIKENQVPVQYKGLLKPNQVRDKVKARLSSPFSLDTHTRAWRYYKVRPASGNAHPEATETKYCVYDELHRDYGYTDAWVEFLVKALSDPGSYGAVVGKSSKNKAAD